MKKDGKKSRQILMAEINTHWIANYSSPTLRYLTDASGIKSLSSIIYHLLIMEKQGLIIYQRNVSRGIVPMWVKEWIDRQYSSGSICSYSYKDLLLTELQPKIMGLNEAQIRFMKIKQGENA